jgi:hypothetical protein
MAVGPNVRNAGEKSRVTGDRHARICGSRGLKCPRPPAYFSIAQRKVLQPNNFPDLDTLEQTLLAFGRHYEQIAQPFEWKFTRKDLHRVLDRLQQPTPQAQLAA